MAIRLYLRMTRQTQVPSTAYPLCTPPWYGGTLLYQRVGLQSCLAVSQTQRSAEDENNGLLCSHVIFIVL